MMGLLKPIKRIFTNSKDEGGSKEDWTINHLQHCKQVATQGASRFPVKSTNGASKAALRLCDSLVPATQPLQLGNENGTAATWTWQSLSDTEEPQEQTMTGCTKSHAPAGCRVRLMNLPQLPSYSLNSEYDDRTALPAVGSFCFRDGQYQHSEHSEDMLSSDDAFCAAHLLLSPSNTESLGLEHKACSPIHGCLTPSTAHEVPEYCHSRVSCDGNAQPRMSSSLAGCNGIIGKASSVLLSTNNVIEEVVPPSQEDSNVLAINTALPRAMKRSVWSVKDYELCDPLHHGHASKVYSADCKVSGLKVVLKIHDLGEMCDAQRCQLFREVNIHAKVQHQNIVQFHCAFMEENCVIIVQEFVAGGDLLSYMHRMGGRLTERAATKLVLQPLLSALQYLHTLGIVHKNIKPENCLLTGDMVLQVAGFGLAVDLRERRANVLTGNLDYMAPEVLRCPTKHTPDQALPGAAHYEMAAHSWAVGAFAYELLCGKPPFRGSEMMETAHNIIKGDVHFPKELSPGAVDFISSCSDPNPANRLTVIKMLNNPWITMIERPPPTTWQRAYLITKSVSHRALPVAGCEALIHQAPAAWHSVCLAQPVAAPPNVSPSELQPSPSSTTAHGVKLQHHLNTKW